MVERLITTGAMGLVVMVVMGLSAGVGAQEADEGPGVQGNEHIPGLEQEEEDEEGRGITIVPGPPELAHERERLDVGSMSDREIDEVQRERGRPEQTDEAIIEEKLGGQLPLDARFTTSEGEEVRLGDLLDGERPVILNLVYFECPMLCGLITNSVMQAVNEMQGWRAGEQYEVITLSFDARETPEQAARTRYRLMQELADPASAEGWHFLVGEQSEIDKVTQATGFNLYWSERVQEYLHPTAFMVLMPDGQVSRYFYGLEHDARSVRLSLVDASDGKVGSTVDRILLFCYDFDPSLGQYTPAALRLMKWAALGSVLLLGAGIGLMMIVGSRRRQALTERELTGG